MVDSARGKAALSVFRLQIAHSSKISSSKAIIRNFHFIGCIKSFSGVTTMGAHDVDGLDVTTPFESAGPAVVKSIKHRDLLNTWLRLYAKHDRLPQFDDYQPERLSDELPDIVYYTIEHAEPECRIVIDSDGTRMSDAYGTRGRGRYLDEYLGPKLAPIVMPIYRECILRRLPVYTISKVDDLYGRKVDYERLLLPFSEGAGVNRIIASLKTISDDGTFEIRNLMRANDVLPIYVYKSVIEQNLFHKMPARISPGDVIEFN